MFQKFMVLRIANDTEPNFQRVHYGGVWCSVLDADDFWNERSCAVTVDNMENAAIVVRQLAIENPNYRYMVVELHELWCPPAQTKLTKFVFENDTLTPCD